MEIFYGYATKFLGVPTQEVPAQLTKLKGRWRTDFSVVALMKEFRVDYSEVVNIWYRPIDLGVKHVIKKHVVISSFIEIRNSV